MVSSPVRQRDVRVDFFRGLALIFIFVDHIQENVLQYVTMQNFGFADAAVPRSSVACEALRPR